MKINPNISAAAIKRYEKTVRHEEPGLARIDTEDKIELSDQARLHASLVSLARNSDADESETRVHAVMNKIASGAYKVDLEQLADRMLNQFGGSNNER